jgi:hypothetical protein
VADAIGLDAIRAARERIAGAAIRTPLVRLEAPSSTLSPLEGEGRGGGISTCG